MLETCGLQDVRRGRRLLEWLCRPAARALARQVLAYDDRVGRDGLQAGATWIVRQHVRAVWVAGQEHIPPSGPLLVLANHPGLTDTMALFASLPRADLRVVAADRPFLRALPYTSRRLIYLPEEAGERLAIVRLVTGHLRSGGAVLTFPGGQIEPDPAVLPGAVEALDHWSESVGLFVRLAPESQIVPAIVSGVLSAAAQRHPLTRLRRGQSDRERFGAMLQILVPAYRMVTVRVAYGPPLAAADLLATSRDARALTRAVIDQARRLIEQPPTDWRVVASRQSPVARG
jgi:hypothetical protein